MPDQEKIARFKKKAYSLLDLKMHDEALAAFDQVVRLDPTSTKLQLERGVFLYRMGRYQEGVDYFDAFLAKHPDHVSALNNKASCLVALGQDPPALDCFKRILGLKPDHAKTWFRAGELMVRQERYDKALGLFSSALDLKPQDDKFWRAKADVLRRLGEADEALRHLNKALQINSSSHDALRDRALIKRELGDATGSVDDLVAALKAKHGVVATELELAESLLLAGRHGDAQAAFESVLAANKDSHRAWSGKGRALAAAGEHARAALCQATGAMIRGDHLGALALFDEAIGHKPDFPEAWSSKGVTLERLERYEDAVAAYQRALQIKPEATVVHHNLGMLLINKLDRESDGLRVLKDMLRYAPDKWKELPREIRLAVDQL